MAMAKHHPAIETSDKRNAIGVDPETNRIVNSLCERWDLEKKVLLRKMAAWVHQSPDRVQAFVLGFAPTDRPEHGREWITSYLEELFPPADQAIGEVPAAPAPAPARAGRRGTPA